jgi:hypothetical protein
MDYYKRELYFEGLSIPQLLRNLGYIQAGFVSAFRECLTYQHTNKKHLYIFILIAVSIC